MGSRFRVNYQSLITNFQSKIQNPKSKIALLLILFTALTLYQSITLPIGEADDETDHYQYLRFVARAGHPPLTEAKRREAGFKGGLAPLYYWLTAWPITLIGEDARPDIRRVDSRPERHIPTDGLGINHVLHTLDEQWPWQGQVLAWHLIRFFSMPMGWITIIATYALARRLVPEPEIVPIGAAAFVAFLPRFVISSAVINDDNLVFALTALFLLIQVAILQSDRPPTPKLMALFGAIFGLSLITKYFSLILIPEVIFTLVVAWLINRRRQASNRVTVKQRTTDHGLRTAPFASRAQPSLPLIPFLAALFVTAGPWFIFIILRFNRIDELGFIPGLAASLGEPQITEGLVGLLSGQSVRPIAATYSLPQWISLLYRSFWFEFGWMRVFAPTWVYALFTVFTLSALIGLIQKIRVKYLKSFGGEVLGELPPSYAVPSPPPGLRRVIFYVSRITSLSAPTAQLLTLHLSLFAIVLLARYILSATIDTGQGRHLYPALPVIALLASLGLNHFGFWILDFGLKKWARPVISTLHTLLSVISNRQPATSHQLPAISYLLPAISYLLPATCYLLPAAISLLPPFITHHSSFIIHNYHAIPVSSIPILLPVDQRQSIEFDSKLWLVGLKTNNTVSAGDTLPVTLYWHAEEEAQQDYLISLCLQDNENRPVGCWRGHFVDGRYHARAWESGDTIVDTIFIPIPTCYRIKEKSYTLHLEIWPLDPTAPTPSLVDPPRLQHTFATPRIAIQATDSLKDLSQTVDLWQTDRRLTGSTQIGLSQSLAQISYANHNAEPSPIFQNANTEPIDWQPLTQLDTPLYLPCDEGPTPFANLSHFIVNPTLTSGAYQSKSDTSLPNINLSFRDRIFAPVTSTLTFSNTLAPLSLQFPDQSTISLITQTNPTAQSIHHSSFIIHHSSPLPLAIRWQARRWMAEPLVIALKLLDKDFAVGGERVATLGNRYPNLLWAPTEIIEETYPIRLKPDTPPGLYQLEMSLIRQDKTLPDGFEYLPITGGDIPPANNLYPITFRLLDPAHDTPPPQPFEAQIGVSIQLTGYEINPAFSDSPKTVAVALYWQSTDKIADEYTVFTQLIGPDGQVWAQWDNPPQAGRYPTTAWAKTDAVIDRYLLSLRQGAPPGDYRLLAGMYNPVTGQRLPVTIKNQPQPDNAIELTTLSLAP